LILRRSIARIVRTIPVAAGDQQLRDAVEGQKALYPQEYAVPIHPAEGGGSQIVASHSLIPQALHHAFSTFGALMSPELPLQRRHHEMIATIVSVTNRCVY
jgi:alkylhydroperoxidase family enzyme